MKPALRSILFLAGVLVLTATVPHAAAIAQERPATLVGVDEVRQEPLSQTVAVLGRIVTKRSSTIAAQVPGAVKAVHVFVGNRVEAGDLVAELDSDTKKAEAEVLRAQMLTAQAELQSARAELTLKEQELDRQARLEKSGAFSKSRHETALQEVLKAKSQIARNKAVIATRKASAHVVQLQIDRARIVAPFAGVIVERYTDSGNYVRNGDPVVKLLSDEQLEIEADIPSIRITGLKQGYRVRANLEDGTEVAATVRAVLPVENPMTRTRPVRFVPTWPQGISRLADSQSITLHLPLGPPRDIVTVHKDAVVRKAGGAMVFVITGGKAASRKVQLGEATGSRFEVIAGLKAGDVTVVRGNERLQPGAKVKVKTGS